MKKTIALLISIVFSTSAFAFGGGGSNKMFDEEWMQGTDAIGVYFGGGNSVDVHFTSCNKPHQIKDAHGVCRCDTGYKEENNSCVKDACATFKTTDCITACHSSGGVATYGYAHVCEKNNGEIGVCSESNCISIDDKVECENLGKHFCDQTHIVYADDGTVLSRQYLVGCFTGCHCPDGYKQNPTDSNICEKNKPANSCNSDEFLDHNNLCWKCTNGDLFTTTPEQCNKCGNKRFSYKGDRTDDLVYCAPQPSGCVKNQDGTRCPCPYRQQDKNGVCTSCADDEGYAGQTCNKCDSTSSWLVETDEERYDCTEICHRVIDDLGWCKPNEVIPPVPDQCTSNDDCEACNKCDTDGTCKPDDNLTCPGGTCHDGECFIPAPTNLCANVTCNPCNSCDTTDGTCKPDDNLTCELGTCSGGSCVYPQGNFLVLYVPTDTPRLESCDTNDAVVTQNQYCSCPNSTPREMYGDYCVRTTCPENYERGEHNACVPTATDLCANVTCNPCNSCDTTDGTCKPDDNLTCTNGTCNNGTCVPNGGSTTACSENNLNACDYSDCHKLLIKLEEFDRRFYYTASNGCIELTSPSVPLCHLETECITGQTFRDFTYSQTEEYTNPDDLLDGKNVPCVPCDTIGPVITRQSECESCGNRTPLIPILESRAHLEAQGLTYVDLDDPVVYCMGPNPTCKNGEFLWEGHCYDCNHPGFLFKSLPTEEDLQTVCDRCSNREMVEDPFYIVSYDDIHYANEYGPICRLKECPTGTVSVGSNCLPCDETSIWAGINDPQYDIHENERRNAVKQSCDLCDNREYISGRGVCRLKQCPENWFRDYGGSCFRCDSLVTSEIVLSPDDCTCSNREAVPWSVMGITNGTYLCKLKECIDSD